MSVKGGLSNAQIQFTETPATGIFASSALPIPAVRVQSTFLAGTAVDQIDGLAEMVLNLAASTPQTINLLTGLTDVLGNALTVARIRMIAIKVLGNTDGQTVAVGGAGTTPFNGFVSGSATVTVYPSSPGNDGFALFSAPNTTGMPVSSGNCNLEFNPGTNAAQVILVVATCSV